MIGNAMIAWLVLENTLMITAFVTMMMLAIEYTNVLSGGAWTTRLAQRPWGQYLMGVVFGAIPGCLGAFAMISLYSHRCVSIGAIVATMIATSGDEAFVMLAMFPRTAVLLFAGLMVLGIVAGWLTDKIYPGSGDAGIDPDCGFHAHENEWAGAVFPVGKFVDQWRHLSATRALLSAGLGLFLVLLVAYKLGFIAHGDITHSGDAGEHGDIGWGWLTLTALTLFGLFIVSTVSDHFLDDHLWSHVLKIHAPRIFLWTLGALSAIALLDHFLDVETLIRGNIWIVLLISVAVGLIPNSGPHLVFVSLFATGALPLSVLVASSVAQDGHGMIPMLAHSRKDFLLVKGINALVGLAVGAAMLTVGW